MDHPPLEAVYYICGDYGMEVQLKSNDVISELKYQKEAHVKEIGTECPVCLSLFADGEEVRQLCVYKHSFHSLCINMWLKDHSNCPVCRASVVVDRSSGDNRTTTAEVRGSDDLQQAGEGSRKLGDPTAAEGSKR